MTAPIIRDDASRTIAALRQFAAAAGDTDADVALRDLARAVATTADAALVDDVADVDAVTAELVARVCGAVTVGEA